MKADRYLFPLITENAIPRVHTLVTFESTGSKQIWKHEA